jgi:hypothetical protein
MMTIWILGAGGFGRRAGIALSRKHPQSKIVLIDHDRMACRAARAQGLVTQQGDGIAFLSQCLNQEGDADWIVPAIPVHVAYQWVRSRLEHDFQIKKVVVPAALVAMLPHPMVGANHTVYTSIADFICPPDCPEPKWGCTVTRQPRPCSVYDLLARYDETGFQMIAIRSVSLAPGVGGYRPRALFRALDRIKRSESPVIVATACACHGVVDTFRIVGSFRGTISPQAEHPEDR